MDKIWLKNYPAGVPAEINPNEIASLQALVERSFAKFADQPAYTCMDRTLTYGDLAVTREYEVFFIRDLAAYEQYMINLGHQEIANMIDGGIMMPSVPPAARIRETASSRGMQALGW